MKRHLVVALAYDGLCIFEFGCTFEIFGIARPELDVPWYDFGVHSVDGPAISASGGIEMRLPPNADLIERADTIVIPGWRGVDAAVPPELIAHLQRAHRRGARLCSICGGAFVLAAAGLLDERAATTHWRFIPAFAARYPRVRILPNALYVDEGSIVTSAGSAAGLDMMLHLVRKDLGAATANRVAQRLVIPPHRDGGQAQYVPQPIAPDAGDGIAAVMEYARRNLHAPQNIAEWASIGAVSRRTLQRRFQGATGLTPNEWLMRERVARARELLESSSLKVSQIAEACGFTSEESFRLHFRRLVEVSPTRYRQQFERRVSVFARG